MILNDLEQTMRSEPGKKKQCTIEIVGYQFEISIEDGEIYAE